MRELLERLGALTEKRAMRVRTHQMDQDALKKVLWQFVDPESMVTELATRAVAVIKGSKSRRDALRRLESEFKNHPVSSSREAAAAVLDAVGAE